MTGFDLYYFSPLSGVDPNSPALIAGFWTMITSMLIVTTLAVFALIMCCKGDERETKVEKKCDEQQSMQTKTDKKITSTNLTSKITSVAVNVDQQPAAAKLTSATKKAKTSFSPQGSPPGSTFKGPTVTVDSVAKLVNLDSFSAKTDLVFVLGANTKATGEKKCPSALQPQPQPSKSPVKDVGGSVAQATTPQPQTAKLPTKVGGNVSPPATMKKNVATPTSETPKRPAAGFAAIAASSIAVAAAKK